MGNPSTTHIPVQKSPILIPQRCRLTPEAFNFSVNPHFEKITYSAIENALENLGKSLTSNPNLLQRTGMEMRHSLLLQSERQLAGPLYYSSSAELSPSQTRLTWGHFTDGFRIDSTSALGLHFKKYFKLEGGYRNTYASGKYKEVEEQRVGYIQATILNTFSIKYFNDHKFPWFPMGGGTDQGDTAGVDLNWRLGYSDGGLFHGFSLTDIGAHLSIATGIPDRNSTVQKDGKTFYDVVKSDEISRGLLSASGTFSNPASKVSLKVELGVDSGAIGDLFQNRIVHRTLDIPEFQKPEYMKLYVGVTLVVPLQ